MQFCMLGPVRAETRYYLTQQAVLQEERVVELRQLERVDTSGLWHGHADSLAFSKL